MKDDWKELLRDEDKRILKELLESTEKNKCAYLAAEDIKVSQLWVALIELKREMDKIKLSLSRIQDVFRNISELGNIEKKKTIKRIISNIVGNDSKEKEKLIEEITERLLEIK